MSLIKETHSMHKIRMRAFTNINCVKSLPRTVPQFRFTYLSNCFPANDERLAVKLDRELSTSFAPFEKERSRFLESAQYFSRGQRESRQRLLHLAHDEEWVAFKKINSELSYVVYPSIDVSKHSPRPFPMTACLSRECKQGRLFVRADLPVLATDDHFSSLALRCGEENESRKARCHLAFCRTSQIGGSPDHAQSVDVENAYM